MPKNLKLGDVSGEFHKLTKKQSEMLIKQFNGIKIELRKKISILGNTKSAKLQKMQLEDAVSSLEQNIVQIYSQFEGELDSSIKQMAEAVVKNENDFMAQAGISFKTSFTKIPTDVLSEIKTGAIYNEKWYLSDAIWADQKNKLRDINTIITNGVAAGKTTYEIAKDLEIYVDPKAVKPWAWSKVYPVSTKVIDYNAQRLARTVIAHAYARATIREAKNNPLSEGIQWHSALTERSCQICIDRDGKVYAPDDLPLDHPNGLCTYTIVTPTMEEIADRLADWVNGADDKELDEWYAKQNGEAEINTPATQKANEAAKSSIPNYTKFVELAKRTTEDEMLELEKESLKNLSAEQRRAIRAYTGGTYKRINKYLRLIAEGRTHSDAMSQVMLDTEKYNAIKNIQSVLQSTQLGKPLVLRRGTDIGELAGFMSGNFENNRKKLMNMSVGDLNSLFEGSVVKYAGFTSTSSIWDRGFTGVVEMVLYAPENTLASSIMGISQFGTGEGETLLNADTTIKILKVEESDGHKASRIRVFAEILT